MATGALTLSPQEAASRLGLGRRSRSASIVGAAASPAPNRLPRPRRTDPDRATGHRGAGPFRGGGAELDGGAGVT